VTVKASVSMVGEVVGPRGDRHRHLGMAGSLINSRPLCDDHRRHLVNRYYDPASSQFLSMDPKVASTMQPYAFVGGDPLNDTDPLGLSGGWNRETLAYARKHQCGVDGHKCVSPMRRIAHYVDNARHFAAHHYGGAVTVVAVGVAFVPGADVADLAIVGAVALSARVANRSTNDHLAPWSAKNLGPNVADAVTTIGSFGLVTAPAAAAEPLVGSMGTAGSIALRARLAAPDFVGFGFSLVNN